MIKVQIFGFVLLIKYELFAKGLHHFPPLDMMKSGYCKINNYYISIKCTSRIG